MTFIAYDSNEEKLYAVSVKGTDLSNCTDKAVALLAAQKESSDGDEFSIKQLTIPRVNQIVEIKGMF